MSYKGETGVSYYKNEKLNILYALLMTLGYEMSDEEKVMKNDRCALIRDAEDARDELLKEENS